MKKILFVLIVILSFQNTYSQDILGEWNGAVNFNGSELKIGLEIIHNGENLEAILKIPQQGLNGSYATQIHAKSDSMLFIFGELGISYLVDISTPKVIKGQIIQNNIGEELILKPGKIEFKRPQTPKEPFKYTAKELSYKSADGVLLSATLTIPNNVTNFPIAIIVSGSGPQNRDGEMLGHSYYLVLADYLSNNGIGVLRFDERGVGKSDGNASDINIENSIMDVEAAISFLNKEYPNNNLGLIGHSIGGIVAPKLATQNSLVKFLVLLAAPGINGDEMMLNQKAAYERGMGLSEIQITQGQAFIKPAYDIIKNGQLNQSQLIDTLNKFFTTQYAAYLEKEQIIELVDQLTGLELIDIIRTQPSTYLPKISIPVLALNGSKDFQVSSKENLDGIKKHLSAAGNKNIQVKELKNLNHVFQEANTGMVEEYINIEQTFSPSALKIIKDWISSTNKKIK